MSTPTHRDQFLALIQRYLDGTCSPEEKEVMDYWYELLDQEEEVDPETRQEQEAAVWASIQQQIRNRQMAARPARQWWQTDAVKWTAAAMVCLLAGLLCALIASDSGTGRLANLVRKREIAGMREEINPGATSRLVTLEDGSRIRLEPGSRVRYPKPFAASQRVVSLTGNAYFEVTKDPARPFSVYTGSIVTRVVGTSFRIQSSAARFELAVVTGKVIVERTNKAETGGGVAAGHRVVLTPNQKVTYSPRQNQLVTALVERPAPVKSLPEPQLVSALRFEETPLADVLQKLEDLYGIEMVLTNDAIRNCPITADLSQHPLYNQLEIICAALRARFEVQGTRIVLTGGSCY